MDSDHVPWAQRPESRLLLILSSERSGATLVRDTLGCHSRLVTPANLFLLRYLDYDAWRAQQPAAIASLLEFFDLVGHPKSSEELDAMLATREAAEVYRKLFDYMTAEGILVDKTSAYGNELSSLERSRPLLPFYLRILRHPLGVVDADLRGKDDEKRHRAAQAGLHRRLLAPLTGAIRRINGSREALMRKRESKWARQNQNFRRFLGTVAPEQQLTIHFEDLVRDPKATVAAICRAMGLREEPGLLAQHDRCAAAGPRSAVRDVVPRRSGAAIPAFEWSNRMSESWLMPHTLQLLKELGVRRLANVSVASRRSA